MFHVQVEIVAEDVVSDNGMVAKRNISKGECLFSLPRTTLLDHSSCKISQEIEKGLRHLHNNNTV